MPTQQWAPPAPGDESVKEGSRWRWHRPSGDAVAAWFTTQPLDEGMEHDHYIGGVVLIPQSEKVKHTNPQTGGTVERYEQVFTPYVQIGTRVGYFHRLAEARDLIPVIEPVDVPRSAVPGSPYFNGNMDDGLWWHVVQGSDGPMRYLCATWRVALYKPQGYADLLSGKPAFPVRAGRGTKQVTGGPDPNGIAKAQTGAIGRALGVAGILVIGTGIATAEDMQELPGHGVVAPSPEATVPTVPSEIAQGEPPVPQSAEEELESLRSRAQALQTQLQEQGKWGQAAAWWQERRTAEGWGGLETVPLEGLKALVSYLERALHG